MIDSTIVGWCHDDNCMVSGMIGRWGKGTMTSLLLRRYDIYRFNPVALYNIPKKSIFTKYFFFKFPHQCVQHLIQQKFSPYSFPSVWFHSEIVLSPICHFWSFKAGSAILLVSKSIQLSFPGTSDSLRIFLFPTFSRMRCRRRSIGPFTMSFLRSFSRPFRCPFWKVLLSCPFH